MRSAASGIQTQAGSAVSATQTKGRFIETGSHMAFFVVLFSSHYVGNGMHDIMPPYPTLG
ncbi:hypothetical protein GCM10007157_09580 [Vreelandella hamiltonii]|uniref:Uncharacterized protein n=1 Tax=Vreelandella hamiltonii TaxID=502829 RepID=A0A8H9LYV9_9GAMM|nr:hypothetical protein GCM10007157_09580 [Halomonas hamiltonii]